MSCPTAIFGTGLHYQEHAGDPAASGSYESVEAILMGESDAGFESEERVPIRPLFVVMLALGVAWILAIDPLAPRSGAWTELLVGLFSLVITLVAWGLAARWPVTSRSVVLTQLVAIIVLASRWLGVPDLLNLMVLPTILAAATIGVRASAVASLGQSVLLLALQNGFPGEPGLEGIGVPLVGIWATFSVVAAMQHGERQRSRWLQQYYRRMQEALEETRQRRADLEQMMDDLADANRRLAMTNERLTALRLIASDAQRTKAAFVAKVSHELRTPLNIIIGLIDVMLEDPGFYGRRMPLALVHDLEVVHRNCEHLSGLIDDVLDLSQAEAGRLTLRRQPVALVAVIEEALAVVRPLLETKQLSLRVTLSSDLPTVHCDRTRIRQVILNLVSNAARFTEAGGVSVAAAREDRHIVVSVCDTGPGIPPEETELIFEPFWQGSSSPWRSHRGTGLGLSITKQIVELHGGRIWLESTPGAGATFFFELPVSPPSAHGARPDRWISREWIWARRESRPALPDMPLRPRILVCDENQGLWTGLRRYSDEVELIETAGPASTLEELHRSPATVVMFNATAPTALWSAVTEVSQGAPDTPLVGCLVPSPLARALEAGAADYLVKPITHSNLEEVIRSVGKPVERVLIVDDDPDVLRLWKRMLRTYDSALEISMASSGEQALAHLHTQPADLVLLDVLMPEMDGWQVLELMNRDEAIRDTPVVLLSAQDPTEQPPTSRALARYRG